MISRGAARSTRVRSSLSCALRNGAEARDAPMETQVDPAPPRVSIVTPCYNGSEYLEDSLRRLLDDLEARRASIGDFEVIFVDDGSTDGSAELVERAFPEIRVIRHPVNRGKGAAVRTGMLATKGRFSFFIDADIPYGLDALEVMLDKLDRKEFHVCIGSRSPGTSTALEKRSLARRLASIAFTGFVSRIVVTGVRDTQCGFKGFQTPIAHLLFGMSRVERIVGSSRLRCQRPLEMSGSVPSRDVGGPFPSGHEGEAESWRARNRAF